MHYLPPDEASKALTLISPAPRSRPSHPFVFCAPRSRYPGACHRADYQANPAARQKLPAIHACSTCHDSSPRNPSITCSGKGARPAHAPLAAIREKLASWWKSVACTQVGVEGRWMVVGEFLEQQDRGAMGGPARQNGEAAASGRGIRATRGAVAAQLREAQLAAEARPTKRAPGSSR